MKNEQETEIDGAFINVLQQHRRGGALCDIAAALREVTAAVEAVGKAGSVTVKITVRPAVKGGALVVEDDIKTVIPKDTEGSIFFADEDGNLLRNDPGQQSLELREVETNEQEPLRKAAQPK